MKGRVRTLARLPNLPPFSCTRTFLRSGGFAMEVVTGFADTPRRESIDDTAIFSERRRIGREPHGYAGG
jgi:hypothetical protein